MGLFSRLIYFQKIRSPLNFLFLILLSMYIHINSKEMTYKERTEDIYNMLGQGQLLEAFDKYYAEDVVLTEPRGTWEGKEACRAHEVEFLSMVKEFHGLDVKSITSDEEAGVVMHETMMDVTFQDGTRAKMEQVGVQRWKDGQIVHERFYYNNAN